MLLKYDYWYKRRLSMLSHLMQQQQAKVTKEVHEGSTSNGSSSLSALISEDQ